MKDLIIKVLENLRVHHTLAFVKRMCIHNIQGNNLLGITRLLEVFGVKSRAVAIGEADDFKDLDLESRVEGVLDGHEIFYNKSETWIQSEKLYEVMYSFEMEGLNNG